MTAVLIAVAALAGVAVGLMLPRTPQVPEVHMEQPFRLYIRGTHVSTMQGYEYSREQYNGDEFRAVDLAAHARRRGDW